MISLNSVSKTFKQSWWQKKGTANHSNGGIITAVDGVSFTCEPGRIFGLIGPNGAGKTTTLRMIATMLQPTSGTIHVCDTDVVTNPMKVRQKMGFLSGNTGLYDRLTAEEMVRYYADLHGMSKEAYQSRRDELFSMMGMEEFAQRRISKLSSGMKQKVSIARTIIHNPEVVVFDEPTTGLDVITSKNIVQLIKRCKEEGKTVIFSTHRFGELKLLCDDLAIIHKGKIYFNGTYAEFEEKMQADSLEDEFIRLVGAEA